MLARIIQDGSAPLPDPPPYYLMGEGQGGGPFLVKRESLFARDWRGLREKRDG